MGCSHKEGSSEYIRYFQSYINFVSKPHTTYLKWMTYYINGLDVLTLFLKWTLFILGVSYPEGSNYIFLDCIFRLKCLVSD